MAALIAVEVGHALQARLSAEFSLSYTEPFWLETLMTDSPNTLAFTPVTLRARRDGWTAERQRIFMTVLRESRSVTGAARAAGMSREGAYALRRQPGAAEFAAAWDAALAGVAPTPDARTRANTLLYGTPPHGSSQR